ncbi:MAG: hypothetical protein VB143_05110 [Burkholderia sp.]
MNKGTTSSSRLICATTPLNAPRDQSSRNPTAPDLPRPESPRAPCASPCFH